LEQITLGRFMEEGYLERHIHKLKKIYKKRRDHLVEVMEKHFSHQVKILGHSTGLHLVAEYQHTVFTEDFVKKMRDNSIRVYPVEDHAIEKGKQRFNEQYNASQANIQSFFYQFNFFLL
jgi:GntR family transcriptional regulator/MocR family aminotransferase